ncbi:MAG: ornithine cyclodeaminase family protein, partial [Rhizobiaceae bacterium]
NRTGANAEQVAATLRAEGMAAEAVSDLEAAARRADVISTCTISSTPLVRGAWLGPGTHVDLVGAFAPSMRESDDEVMRRGRVHVDTMAGATKEAGDIVQALASGALTAERIEGDLFGLCRAGIGRRRDASDITVFKSVGAAIEDLAGGILVYRRLSA